MSHKPLHPGIIVKDALIENTSLSVTQAAQLLDITRTTLSRLLNGRTGISPEMAVRLSKFFNTSVESWINLQAQYDAWLVQQNTKHIHVRPFVETASTSIKRLTTTEALEEISQLKVEQGIAKENLDILNQLAI